MNFVLREAVFSDIPRIEELYIEMLKSIYNTDDVKGYENGYLNKFFDGHDDRIYLAEISGSVIAYLSVEVHRENDDVDFIYLDDLSVSANYRSSGVGTALIKAAQEYAAKLNISVMALHVERTNIAALRLYTRLGFIFFRDDGSRYLMKKTLCNSID